jgi:hypothetical protein
VRAFFAFMSDLLPTDVNITVSGTGDLVDDTTGLVVGGYSGADAGVVVGADAGPYSAPTGLCITWNTGVVLGGRRLRGRTFLVPIGGTSYDGTGTILDGRLAVARVAAGNLIASGIDLSILSRVNHTSMPVTTATIADRAAVLRTRRS